MQASPASKTILEKRYIAATWQGIGKRKTTQKVVFQFDRHTNFYTLSAIEESDIECIRTFLLSLLHWNHFHLFEMLELAHINHRPI